MSAKHRVRGANPKFRVFNDLRLYRVTWLGHQRQAGAGDPYQLVGIDVKAGRRFKVILKAIESFGNPEISHLWAYLTETASDGTAELVFMMRKLKATLRRAESSQGLGVSRNHWNCMATNVRLIRGTRSVSPTPRMIVSVSSADRHILGPHYEERRTSPEGWEPKNRGEPRLILRRDKMSGK